MRCGIGTFIWSRIYHALYSAGLLPMQLSGLLSSTNATVYQVGEAGRLVRKYSDGALYPVRVANTERRNAFWKRMLDTAGGRFECDHAGNGDFTGQFIDPAADPSYRPAFQVMLLAPGALAADN